jgi:hypothetical protein
MLIYIKIFKLGGNETNELKFKARGHLQV